MKSLSCGKSTKISLKVRFWWTPLTSWLKMKLLFGEASSFFHILLYTTLIQFRCKAFAGFHGIQQLWADNRTSKSYDQIVWKQRSINSNQTAPLQALPFTHLVHSQNLGLRCRMNLVVTEGVDPRHIFPHRGLKEFPARAVKGAAWREDDRAVLGRKFSMISYPISQVFLTRFLLLWNQLNSAWNRLSAHSNRQGPTNSERSSLSVTHSTKAQTRICSFIVGVPFLEFHFCIMGWACKRSHNMEGISQRTVSKALYIFFTMLRITLQFSQDRSTWLTLKPFQWKTPQDQSSNLWFLGFFFVYSRALGTICQGLFGATCTQRGARLLGNITSGTMGLGIPLELVI